MKRRTAGVLVAATGQHVGKTTSCLGIVHGLRQRVPSLAYCKPVGQKHVTVPGATGGSLHVDKDCFLFKEHFGLTSSYDHMSPVLMPRGFTRKFLDGEVTSADLMQRIQTSVRALSEESQFVLCEGTGHIGVGSICDLNNAQVAACLGMDVVLVALGGLGSSFDELAINKAMLDAHGVRLRGVILNQVLPSKRDMVMEYYAKALDRWGVPLLGCIPFNAHLRFPTIKNLRVLLDATLVSGEKFRMRHFANTRLAVGIYNEEKPFAPVHNQLVVTHSTRLDVVRAVIDNHRQALASGAGPLEGGLILTGHRELEAPVVAELEELEIPCLKVPNGGHRNPTYEVLKSITEYTSKLDVEDPGRLNAAIEHVNAHVDIDRLLASTA